ncbi:creatininase family protein [Pelomonas sp. SE-A7]|uniref:creatininase family protein n=1 Tax=Pelomonas sp. SE-A7 TaxID=3054953 RepID=UPI00259D1FAA|nr:creatininase family protein [Pelomonas sp. SE-A7]MDM4764700.1 creatininase family protein [Pelomonas sp. SE-A7]
MRVSDCNWMRIEQYLKDGGDLAVLPLGSVEQHAYLSLAVDALLAEAIAVEAAEPLGVPVFPAQAYGHTPTYMAYPGTMSLSFQTLLAVLRDLVGSLHHHGFRRVLIVNGHGGNGPAAGFSAELQSQLPGLQLKWHHWWAAPRTMAFVREQDPQASHASWMENLPGLTRLAGVTLPEQPKPLVDYGRMALMDPVAKRAYLGDGCYGGHYQMPDEVTQQMWAIAVEETRAAIQAPWLIGQ